jgi:DNA-binding LytR/AlgR family response regulator
MKNLLIVEDEPFAQDDLKESLLQIYPSLRITAVRTAPEAMDALAVENFDAIFLDLELPGMDGIEMLRRLPPPTPPVVIVTAHAFNALEGFGLGVVDCLLKPVDEDRLRKALEKITVEEEAGEAVGPASTGRRLGVRSRVLVRVGPSYRLLRVGGIVRIEQTGQGTHVFFDGGSGYARSSLMDLEGILDPENFFRINHSDIVNLDHVDTIEIRRDGLLLARFSDGLELSFSPDRSKVFERERQI